MKIAVPDLISNSYFPAVAAVELGKFAEQGINASIELVFPVNKAYAALRDGEVDCVAGSAHSALAAFPEWSGAKLLCAQAQGMYWFLVMRSDLACERGDVSIVKGRKIGAAPWVEMGLRRLLVAAGIDAERDNVTIAPVPNTDGSSVNFGLMAAKALAERSIDGFWANGMGTEVAVRSGAGRVVLDVRRGDGPAECFNYTMASLAVTDHFLAEQPDKAAAMVRAMDATHTALKQDPSLAAQVGRKVFPEYEASLIAGLIERDLPYYSSAISPEFVTGMNAFARDVGILKGDPAYGDVVARIPQG
ncbi:ABC transporter substrate-binding protein [Tardiphaga sp.]|uniref:ABC transporter substrate-binding protein n=1 Tax=Tardiphaga sp. TaxID=1926292 RepID=UPI002606F59D|nr:ABC transporter substrate-binding protein [Tardiphaga sp.]MDB5619933.1 putative ABC-type nitrate/sulfonate/bicarbonate transport system periplasmic component [Tardiphaga sp.]